MKLNKNAKYALQGVKVVELATVVAAPTAARILSDFGAEVVKVEAPGGDLLRETGRGHAMPTEVGNNPLFDMFNTNKKMVSLDLKNPEGMKIMKALLAQADIFISNVRMPSLKRMALDYESLHEEFPELIYAHFSGFGLEGEEAPNPGFDSTAFWMRSGSMLDTLVPGSFPIRPSYAFGDLATASAFVSGILMALYARTQGADGTLVSTSLLNSGLWCSSTQVINAQEKYGRQYPLDRYSPWSPFGDAYQCADGEWVGIFEKQYSKEKFIFAELFDMPELINDPDLENLRTMEQSGKKAQVVRRIAEKIAEKTSAEWIRIFRENDIATERIRHFREASQDKQAWANGYLEEVDYHDGAMTAVPTPPVQFSEFGRRAFSAAKGIGGDTNEVLSTLGYGKDEIAALREKKAVR